jgi:hypothetical protein
VTHQNMSTLTVVRVVVSRSSPATSSDISVVLISLISNKIATPADSQTETRISVTTVDQTLTLTIATPTTQTQMVTVTETFATTQMFTLTGTVGLSTQGDLYSCRSSCSRVWGQVYPTRPGYVSDQNPGYGY